MKQKIKKEIKLDSYFITISRIEFAIRTDYLYIRVYKIIRRELHFTDAKLPTGNLYMVNRKKFPWYVNGVML